MRGRDLRKDHVLIREYPLGRTMSQPGLSRFIVLKK